MKFALFALALLSLNAFSQEVTRAERLEVLGDLKFAYNIKHRQMGVMDRVKNNPTKDYVQSLYDQALEEKMYPGPGSRVASLQCVDIVDELARNARIGLRLAEDDRVMDKSDANLVSEMESIRSAYVQKDAELNAKWDACLAERQSLICGASSTEVPGDLQEIEQALH